MSTYRRSLHHIIFATKHRANTLPDESRQELYAYINGICSNLNCHVYRIGGYRDHIHMLIDLHPSVALADLVRTIKINSSRWMKESGTFPNFDHWQDGYAAFTVTWTDRDALIEYIKNQEEHHREVSLLDEFKEMLVEMGIEIDERYLP
jgi:putative transposase